MKKFLFLIVAMSMVATIVHIQAAPEDKFFSSAGVRLRYLEQGAGEAIVLLHGNGASARMWITTGIMDRLATRYRVIALDCRGFGKSDKPHDPSSYGANMGEDVVRLLDHLSIMRSHLIGYSMGARITSWLVVNHPERVITATLGGSTYFTETTQQGKAFEESARNAEAEPNSDDLKRSFPDMTDEQVNELPTRRATTNDPKAIEAVRRGYPGLYITESALSSTKVPILHVVGSEDTSRLPASQHLKDHVLPDIEFVIVPGATHSGRTGLAGRKEFVEAIEKFLSSNRSGL